MTGLTLADVARLTGGKLSGASDGGEVKSLIIDSRLAAPGALFAALRGERTDGHEYISAALDKGALGCLAEMIPAGEGRGIVLVPDVPSAMKALAGEYRKTLNIPLIGVTGSVGKTTAKEMTAAVLSRALKVHKTEKNFNNELGVPMSICGIDADDEAAVIEMGISDFGEMRRLAETVRPTIALFTVIGSAHLECLRDLDGVFRAKTEMLEYLAPGGLILANGDDEHLKTLKARDNCLLYGLGADNDVRAENLQALPEGTACDIVYAARRIRVSVPAYGRHLVYAALAAAAAGIRLGLSDAQIAAGIADYAPVGRRASVIKTGRITIVDDCYNANPDSVKSAADSLAGLSGRRVCILGDMLELGEESERLHRETGRYAAERGAELVITAGVRAAKIAEGAAAAGAKTARFETTGELIKALPRLIRNGDAVLVKASHSMRFEDISEALKTL